MQALAQTPGAILDLLGDIEFRCRSNAAGLPQQLELRENWSGIGFRIGDLRLVAPLGEVREILRPPPLTRVPGAKPWVKGIANVRGNLLPVMELSHYLELPTAPWGRRSRVLVAQRLQGLLRGSYLLDEVLWPVFSLHALAASQQFREVAL